MSVCQELSCDEPRLDRVVGGFTAATLRNSMRRDLRACLQCASDESDFVDGGMSLYPAFREGG